MDGTVAPRRRAPEGSRVAAGLEPGRLDDVDRELEAVADPARQVRVAPEGDRGPALLPPPADLVARGEGRLRVDLEYPAGRREGAQHGAVLVLEGVFAVQV